MEVKPILSFGFDIDIYEEEISMKGYCNDAFVTLPDESKFKVCFYDPHRLIQDLQEENYIAEPGLIIIESLTKEKMQNTIYEIWLNGFFDQLKPI